MTVTWISRPAFLSHLWPAALLGVGGAVGLWLWPTQGSAVRALPATAVFALTVVLGVLWQYRTRAARRWSAAVDAYAERELARARHANALQVTKQVRPDRSHFAR
jgi:hypothetical protein